MSTSVGIRRTASGRPATEAPARRDRGVAVVYEGRDEGHAALLYALELARGDGVTLTVLSVASRDRTDVGCGSAREGALFRNELACEFAAAQLAEARSVIESQRPAAAVEYVLARGSFMRAVPAGAGTAGVIVLSARRRGRLRRILSRDRAETLGRRTSASVVVAPAATVRPPGVARSSPAAAASAR